MNAVALGCLSGSGSYEKALELVGLGPAPAFPCCTLPSSLVPDAGEVTHLMRRGASDSATLSLLLTGDW